MLPDLNILLIEDNPGDVMLIEEFLSDNKRFTFNLNSTETLKSGLERLENNDFDVILLDLGLPDSAGLEALEIMQNKAYGIPIVVITGLDDDESGRKAIEMGAQNYILKSYMNGKNISDSIIFAVERNKILQQLKQKDAQLTKNNKALLESNSAKNLLISIISHDLRGPLNSIVSLLELINDKFDEFDNESKKKYLKSILLSASNTKHLMENLLEWAHVQSERKKVEPEKTALAKLVQTAINPLLQVALNKEIEISQKIAANSFVYSDPKMINTVIRNLVSNALKFTPRKGKIVVSSEKVNSHQIRIKIKDNGTGIEKKTLNTLFEPGRTTSSRGTENESGSGFGLILCKEFVEKNKGKLTVESEPEKGTTVSLTLPLS